MTKSAATFHQGWLGTIWSLCVSRKGINCQISSGCAAECFFILFDLKVCRVFFLFFFICRCAVCLFFLLICKCAAECFFLHYLQVCRVFLLICKYAECFILLFFAGVQSASQPGCGGPLKVPLQSIKKDDKMKETAAQLNLQTLFNIIIKDANEIQGDFFHWYPPKKLKHGKPRLGESTLT